MNESLDQSLWMPYLKSRWEARYTAGVVDNILLHHCCWFVILMQDTCFRRKWPMLGGVPAAHLHFLQIIYKDGTPEPLQTFTLHPVALLRWGRWPPSAAEQVLVKDLLRMFQVIREVPTLYYQGASKEAAHTFSEVELNDGWAAASWIAKAKQVQKSSESSESLLWIHLEKHPTILFHLENNQLCCALTLWFV